jgi:hypothetical protein
MRRSSRTSEGVEVTRAVLAVPGGNDDVNESLTAAEAGLPFPADVVTVEIKRQGWQEWLARAAEERTELVALSDGLRRERALRPFVAAFEDRFLRLDLPGAFSWYTARFEERGKAEWPWVFICNVCGVENRVTGALPGREEPSCNGCKSTVRYRATVRALVEALLGEDLALPDVDSHPEIRGIGLSDWAAYAVELARLFSYTNTHFDDEPHLDLTELPHQSLLGAYDFAIAGDVLEHVAPPVEASMAHLRSILRQGGVTVLTVPFTKWPEHIEHFPELHHWSLDVAGGEPVLVNERTDGTVERFTSLCFHGPGRSLEMRVFTQQSFVSALESAGFVDIHFSGHTSARHGILLPEWPGPVVAKAP